MSHPRSEDQDRSIKWARRILANKSSYVILDTETTGINRNSVVVEIAIIDLDGNPLFKSRVKPTKRKKMSNHGIIMYNCGVNLL